MTVLDNLKVVIEGDASGLQNAFAVAARVLQKLETALDKFEASANRHGQATDRVAAAHTRMAGATEKATVRAAAAQAKAERDFFKLATAAERATAREAASVARAAAAVDRAAAKKAAAVAKMVRDHERVAAAADRAAKREQAAADRAAKAVARAADQKAAAATKAAAKQEAAAERAARSHDKDAAGWAKEIAIFQRYRAALYLVGAGLQSVFKIAEDGARASAAEAYFRNAGKSIAEFRTATNGLISDAELMKKVNLADTMGLSGEVFKTLANVAHASAAKTGQSYEHMLNSIVLGTARESRLLLDNLGIIVNVTDAKKNYAKALKEGADAAKYSALTVDQLAASLTDAGEKAAFFADVEKQGLGPLLEQAEIGGTAADNFDRFSASVDNLKIAIGKLLAEGGESALSKLAAALQGVADKLELINRYKISGGGFFDKLGATIQHGASLAMEGDTTALMGGPAGLALAGAASASEEQKAIATQLWIQTLDKLQNELNVPAADALNRNMLFLDDATEAVVKEFRELSKRLGYTLPKKGVGTGPEMVDPEKVLAAKKEKSSEATRAREKAEKEWADKLREAQKSFDTAMTDYDKLKAEFDEDWQKWGVAHKEMLQAESDAYREYENALLAADYASQKAKHEKTVEDATTGVDQAHSIISASMSGSASGLGAAIGGFFGPLGVAIGSLIGELLDPLTPVIELLGHLASGIKGLLELGLNPFLETLRPLGPALELLLRSVGVLIAGALRPLIPHMQGLVFILTAVIDVVALVIVFWATVAEIAVSITSALFLFWGALWNIVTLLTGWMPGGGLDNFTESMGNAVYWIDLFTKGMVDAIVLMNNGIVSFIRKLGRGLEDVFGDDFGLRQFGDKLVREDLMPDTTPIEENTDATGDNTRAVEQLSRDLRNLPSGYKVNYALYGATAPVRQYPGVSDSIGAANRSRYGGNPPNYRWRT